MQRQRVAADYLQTSAVIDAEGLVHSAVNDPNTYVGPGTGYRLEGERWELLQALPHVVDPRRLGGAAESAAPVVDELGPAEPGDDPTEVVVALGPAFADAIRETINGLAARATSCGRCATGCGRAVARRGSFGCAVSRTSRSSHTTAPACPARRVALGVQSKGTAVIHRADLKPLDNLELFGMSPLYSLESYRAMGRNAAGYALGHRVGPVPTELDNFARAKLIVRTTLLHAQETRAIVGGRARRSSSPSRRLRVA